MADWRPRTMEDLMIKVDDVGPLYKKDGAWTRPGNTFCIYFLVRPIINVIF